MIATLNEIFEQKPSGAIAAFNVFSYEDAYPVVKAAEKLNTPVILMANRNAVKYMGVDMFSVITRELAKKSSVAVCIHLDHSISYEDAAAAIEAGFTSVMYDGSSLPVEQNIAITKQVVAAAHKKGVSVEAEIGHVGMAEEGKEEASTYTTPKEAQDFHKATDVDALAISIGTLHRMQVQAATLQFDLLKQIKEATSVPLVIHGSTGVTDEDLHKLSLYGARKVNIGTALRMEFGKQLRKQINDNPKEFDRLNLFPACMDAVYEKALEKLKILEV